ncbi:cellulose binding domain-containing protein [Dactylosporangium sp. NPDC000521]|uniref:cellulose binding domain-containing protein n=1 Tax=Dactylosporangium sp. NPDC000521 TaxID=3363975 RepID=UPI003687F61E
MRRASGLTAAVWDGRMNDAATTGLLRDASVKLVRYPGGGYGDGYHWQTHPVEGGGYVAGNTEFDPFVAMAHAAGAQPIITANAWNATVTQTGNAVTARNLSCNATIPAGGSTSFGFQGTWTTGDADPGTFTLNGTTCAIG